MHYNLFFLSFLFILDSNLRLNIILCNLVKRLFFFFFSRIHIDDKNSWKMNFFFHDHFFFLEHRFQHYIYIHYRFRSCARASTDQNTLQVYRSTHVYKNIYTYIHMMVRRSEELRSEKNNLKKKIYV